MTKKHLITAITVALFATSLLSAQTTPKKICDLTALTSPAPDLFFEVSAACAGSKSISAANLFSSKFIVQGTSDSLLSAAQFLGSLGTGIVKNTTSTGVLSIAVPGDFPTLNQSTSGNAATCTALASAPTTCSAGFAARGVDTGGNALNCTAVGGNGTVTSVTGPASLLSWATNTTTPTASLATQSANTLFGNNTGSTAAPTFFNISALDHNALTNLATGDVHTQYANINGRSGGQTINGGTGSGDLLKLHGSTNGTSGGVAVSAGDNFNINGSNGQSWVQGQASELVTLNGTPKDTTGNLLPANSVIAAVVIRIITGASGSCSAFNIGDPTTAARFAASTAVTTGTTIVGLAHVDQTGAAGPRQTSATTVRFTCVSGTLTGGSARVTVFYSQFVAPAN